MGIEQLTVEYIDHCGSDLSVANSARVSFDTKTEMDTSDVWGPPTLKDKDARLIKYLADHEHYSPFNHTFVTFRCHAPIFVMGQLKKHEYMPWNEVSRRYTDDEPTFYEPDVWRGRSADKKQGSEGTVDLPEYAHIYSGWKGYEGKGNYYSISLYVYKDLLKHGVAPEMARMVLPQAMMSSWIWSGTVKAVAKMCKLRCTSDTQYESRVIADKISTHMHKLFPVSWGALME